MNLTPFNVHPERPSFKHGVVIGNMRLENTGLRFGIPIKLISNYLCFDGSAAGDSQQMVLAGGSVK